MESQWSGWEGISQYGETFPPDGQYLHQESEDSVRTLGFCRAQLYQGIIYNLKPYVTSITLDPFFKVIEELFMRDSN